VGTGGFLQVSGSLIGGPDSELNESGDLVPTFDDGVNINVGVAETQGFTAYIDDFARFTIDAGVTLTLETSSIYDNAVFTLGGRHDTTDDRLVLNAGSVSADTTVTFNNAPGTKAVRRPVCVSPSAQGLLTAPLIRPSLPLGVDQPKALFVTPRVHGRKRRGNHRFHCGFWHHVRHLQSHPIESPYLVIDFSGDLLRRHQQPLLIAVMFSHGRECLHEGRIGVKHPSLPSVIASQSSLCVLPIAMPTRIIWSRRSGGPAPCQ